jgi:hypothetical protein
MKKKISGNGVTVANRFKVVNQICTKNWWEDSKIKKLNAVTLSQVWNYRSEGLTLDQAKSQLLGAIQQRTKKFRRWPEGPSCPQSPNKYLNLSIKKKQNIGSFLDLYNKSEHVNQYFLYNYGTWKNSCKYFALPDVGLFYPVIAQIYWETETDWDHYAKNYGFAKNTTSNRMVVFKTIGKLGEIKTIFEYPLTSFSGNFMEKAIAAFQRIDKVKCPKALKPIQLADYFHVLETKSINGYRLFHRYIGAILWDHAILDTKTGNTYHAYTDDKLIPGLRNKISAKLEKENELISKQTGFSLGFCQTGMKQFCDDNSIDYEGEYTRSELRNIVIQKRTVNVNRYRNELKRIGIGIS